MPRPKKSERSHGEGIPPSGRMKDEGGRTSGRMKDEGGRMNESGPADLTHPSSFIPQPSEEVPAIEALYDEVLAQELERRGWECFPPDGPDA